MFGKKQEQQDPFYIEKQWIPKPTLATAAPVEPAPSVPVKTFNVNSSDDPFADEIKAFRLHLEQKKKEKELAEQRKAMNQSPVLQQTGPQPSLSRAGFFGWVLAFLELGLLIGFFIWR